MGNVSHAAFGGGTVKNNKSSNGGGGNLESRVAKLEASVEHIQSDLTDVKADIKEIKSDIKGITVSNANLGGKITTLMWAIPVITTSLITVAALAIKTLAP